MARNQHIRETWLGRQWKWLIPVIRLLVEAGVSYGLFLLGSNTHWLAGLLPWLIFSVVWVFLGLIFYLGFDLGQPESW